MPDCVPLRDLNILRGGKHPLAALSACGFSLPCTLPEPFFWFVGLRIVQRTRDFKIC
jgi:hypothetical protein